MDLHRTVRARTRGIGGGNRCAQAPLATRVRNDDQDPGRRGGCVHGELLFMSRVQYNGMARRVNRRIRKLKRLRRR
jgi:hypothetical protein